MIRSVVVPARSLGRPSRALAAVAGGVVGFMLLNLVVAVTLFASPGRRIDSALGDVASRGLLVSGSEGYCVTHVSSTGFRGPEPASVRTFASRILFLGDSYTEAIQVMDRDTYVVRVQETLRGSGERVVCVNAGTGGANPAAYIYQADALKAAYSPTLVVVQVEDEDFGWGTVVPRTRGCWLDATDAGWTPRRAEIAEGTQRLRNLATRLPAAYWLLKKYWAGTGEGPGQDATPGVAVGTPGRTGADRKLVDWLLTALHDKYGSNLVILYTPAFDYFGGANVPTSTETEVREASARLGIGFVDPRGAFAVEYARTRQPLQGFSNTALGEGHWNAAGHAVVAAEVVRFLVSGEGMSN